VTETGREGWTKEERELYDAKAGHEAWEHARSILDPLVQVVHEVGSDELIQVMEKALMEVEGELNRALDKLEALQEIGEARG
jgi:hypothetical protein